MNSATPKTDYLFACCRNIAHETGIPFQLILAHALLFATAMLGDKGCYRRNPSQPPQIIASPTTVMTTDELCPIWLASVFSRIVGHQQLLTKRAKDEFNLLPRPHQIKRARHLVKMYAPIRELLPDQMAFLADTLTIPTTPETYVCLHDVRDGKKSKLPVGTAFSPHLLVLSTGVACYKDIIAQLCESGSRSQAAGETAARFRVTSHGWAEMLPMRKLIRKLGFNTLRRLGWLLEYPGETAAPDFAENLPQPYLHFFDTLFSRRLGPPVTFLPAPAVIEILDGAVDAQRQRAYLRGIPETVINPEPMLPWQIATVLWACERSHENPKPENNLQLADRACQVARLIHELHFHTIRRIFPTVEENTVDIIDAAIVDKLAVCSLHPRELGRKFHRLGTENLKVRLRSLAKSGVVQKNEDGRWSLQQFDPATFSDVMDHMSAKSTISDNF